MSTMATETSWSITITRYDRAGDEIETLYIDVEPGQDYDEVWTAAINDHLHEDFLGYLFRTDEWGMNIVQVADYRI